MCSNCNTDGLEIPIVSNFLYVFHFSHSLQKKKQKSCAQKNVVPKAEYSKAQRRKGPKATAIRGVVECMCVCVCLCVYVCVCLCVYVCVYVCLSLSRSLVSPLTVSGSVGVCAQPREWR